MCRRNPAGADWKNFSFRRKTIQRCFCQPKANCVFICRVIWWRAVIMSCEAIEQVHYKQDELPSQKCHLRWPKQRSVLLGGFNTAALQTWINYVNHIVTGTCLLHMMSQVDTHILPNVPNNTTMNITDVAYFCIWTAGLTAAQVAVVSYQLFHSTGAGRTRMQRAKVVIASVLVLAAWR